MGSGIALPAPGGTLKPERSRAFERQIGLEIAVLLQEVDHALAVFGGDVLVERAFANAFGEQLGDVAAGIVDDAAFGDGRCRR